MVVHVKHVLKGMIFMKKAVQKKCYFYTRDRMVHTKEEMQKDRDTERVKSREREFPGGPVVRTPCSHS